MPTTALSRRHFLRGVGAAATALGTAALLRGAEEQQPNVVFILIDDLGWNTEAIVLDRYQDPIVSMTGTDRDL